MKTQILNFTKENENLDILLCNQRCVFEKSGLGYNPEKKNKKLYSTLFVKESTSSTSCVLCGKDNFHDKHCIHKKCLNMEQTYLGAKRHIYWSEWTHEIIGAKTNTLRFFLIGKEGKMVFRTYNGWQIQIYFLQWKECWTFDIQRWYQEKGKRYH